MLVASDKTNLHPQNVGLCCANGVPQNVEKMGTKLEKVSNATKAQRRVKTQNPTMTKFCYTEMLFT